MVGEATSIDRNVGSAGKKILKAQKVDLSAIECIEVEIHAVEAEFTTCADAMAAAIDNDRIGQSAREGRGGRH